jgi:hypothetical protein
LDVGWFGVRNYLIHEDGDLLPAVVAVAEVLAAASTAVEEATAA